MYPLPNTTNNCRQQTINFYTGVKSNNYAKAEFLKTPYKIMTYIVFLIVMEFGLIIE